MTIQPGAPGRFRRMIQGFTLIELIVVIAIIGILALIALPSIQQKLVRDQIVEAAPLADLGKKPVATAWTVLKTMPSNNAAAGLPVPEKVVSNLVSSVEVEEGAVHVTFGNKANAAIRGKVLTFRPAVVEDAPVVPVAWVCGHASPPKNMTVRGADKTTLEDKYLPLNCKAEKKQGPA
jgi:type IV pilus assembly protein PilA